MSDGDDTSRPSFTEFWRKSKETLGAKKIRFVESKPSSGADSEGAGSQDAGSSTSTDKAQARRAQVRKAQKQHRQRKANYVKELEMDIVRIRDMIEAAERDTKALLDENKAMRMKIVRGINNRKIPLSLDQRVSLARKIPQPAELSSTTRAALQPEPQPVTVSLGFDEVINAPTFYISSPPPTGPSQPSSQEPSQAPDVLPDLTPDQAQEAINFILALEHICRDHFHPSLYQPPPPGTVHSTPLFGHEANGHTLMATSLALRSAPEHIFEAASRSTSTTARFLSRPSSRLRPICPSTSHPNPPATSPPTSNPFQTLPAPSPSTTAHQIINDNNPLITINNQEDNNTNTDTNSNPSWNLPPTTLTLQSLHGLASCLNPDDQVEITPVQAWFELVARFGAERLMAAGVLDTLKRELVPVVECPHFGAVVGRGVFEGVLGRVFGCGE